MKRSISTLAALAFGATLCLGAQAQDAAASAPAPVLNKQEAKDLKTESKAAYKAGKDVANANKELNKGDCEVAFDGSAERACKKTARAQAKADKAQAKAVHEAEKDAIKANSK